MGCRFPGARNLQEYWRLLVAGRRRFSAVPPERWDHSAYYDPDDKRASKRSYTDRIAVLDEVDQFDAAHFRMSPRRVQAMDPQHRLLLQTSREALQDAGWERKPFDRHGTGVFFGMSSSEYMELSPDVRTIQPFTVPGGLLNMAAATVSQYFDLGGPSFTVDAACSSSLIALQEAVTHLRAGHCSAALVGGAYLALAPVGLVGFAKVGALSMAGVCRPFDRRADGFVLGEGIGTIVLRPLDEAVAAGDRVYAVVRGIGVSNDGTTDGPMTPRTEGQVLALERAYADAEVNPRSVGFIEAHGTATVVGDRVELEALKRIRATDDEQPEGTAYLSSVKSLIGHSLSASGMASLIKAALVLHYRTIVPQPETEVDPEAGLAEAGLRIPAEPTPWEANGSPRRASVSGFGFGGTNAHIVLEEGLSTVATAAVPDRPELFLFSAATPALLAQHVGEVLDELAAMPTVSHRAVAHTLASRRLLPARLAVVAGDREELRTRLIDAKRSLEQGRLGHLGDAGYAGKTPLPLTKRAVAFLFPGQGSQRPGMLGDLYQRFAALRERADTLDAVLRREAGFSGLEAVYGPDAATEPGRARLTGTDVCQPSLGVLGLAAARTVTALGVAPMLTLGHSVGEFPAAAVAGALSDEEVVRLLALRGARMRKAEQAESGGMLALRASAEQTEQLLQGVEGAWLSGYNHPRQTVVSGRADGLAEVARRCAAEEIDAHQLEVSNGFHSPLLAGTGEGIAKDLASAPIVAPGLRYVSSVSGLACENPEELRELWASHAVAPIRFAAAAEAAYAAGARIFVQVLGGHTVLATMRQNLREHDDAHYVELSAEEPDDGRTFLGALGLLAVLGVPVDPMPLFDPAEALLSLPASPLRTRRYWVQQDEARHQHTSEPAPEAVKEHPMSDVVTLLREQLAVLQAFDPVAVPAAPAPLPEPAKAAPPAAGEFDRVRSTVYDHISRISAFPIDQLHDEHLVVQELGFDSLMLTELVGSVQKTWPQVSDQLKAGAIAPRPTIAEIVSTVGGMLNLSPTPAPAKPEPGDTTVAPEYRIEDFPEAQLLASQLSSPEHNPYFLLHEGTASGTTRIDGRELVCFSSYNYLGLTGHPVIKQAVTDALDTYGSSVSASRFLSGDRPVHQHLEAELARLLGTEDAIVLVSGHATNVSVIGHLLGPQDLVVHDELAHDSILQGCKLSGARRLPFPHNDMAELDALLTRARKQYRRALVVVEGVYSMDGDLVDLPRLIEVKQRHGVLVMVDEAHSVGTVGPNGGGVGDHFDVDRSAIDLWSGTLSKSLSSCGGYVAGSANVVQYLKYSVPGFVYSVGLTPTNTAAALASLRVLREEPERLARLRSNAALFLDAARKAGLNTGPSEGSPVVPCVVGDSALTLRLAEVLFERGISVNPIMYPAVPEHEARLRFFITSEHTAEQITRTVSVVAEELQRLRAN
ncbi:aminotransferase class I/II-fold pyridoxal phosphate-dependent enzyme [Amycolatopsis panacis]|uniref:Aminotransferase class I/II-fold pyridoxal phosphate-dependent enzyme n=2 Tax=Amycolatopsis panacis TaxID=2340917 RepID=A0A419HWC5_9PSEU|nr:aminotransferase class I/II-fold pyridoxal phosphate-dependent enzyme [Amycolatopsis panacis]